MRLLILTIAVVLGSWLGAQSTSTEVYSSNLLAISPFMAYGSSSFNDVGVGLGFEHFFNSSIALESDVVFGLNNEMLQFMVGPKFYPRGHDKPVSYGLAPVFLITRGAVLSNGGCFICSPSSYVETLTYFQFGFMLVNSVNMTLNEKIYFGIEAGLGINYINRYSSDVKDELSKNVPGGNRLFRFSMGYRF